MNRTLWSIEWQGQHFLKQSVQLIELLAGEIVRSWGGCHGIFPRPIRGIAKPQAASINGGV
jgi:hypothetical protein